MATKRKKKKTSKKNYRFQLSLQGIAGIGVVCFCLFVWMFLLGIWAGQTFLLPSAKPAVSKYDDRDYGSGKAVETLTSTAKKKPSSSLK